MNFTRKFHSSRSGGFSLVELLVVISIITIMSLLVQPAVTSLYISEGFSGNVTEITDLIKQARAKAMSQNTFVWLGFTTKTINGNPSIIVSVIAGKSGMSSDFSSNCVSVMKPMVLRNVQIVNSTGLNLGFSTTNNADLSQSAAYTFSQSVGGTNVTFSNVIVFSPDGEATLNTAAQPNRFIDVGLKAGPAAASNAQVAAIQISGLCGKPTLFRQ